MTGPRSRRAVLRTGALAVLGLGGCVGEQSGGTTAPDSTTAGTGVTTTTDGTADEQTRDPNTRETTAEETGRTTVESAALEIVPKTVQTSFFYNTTPDSMDVAAAEGTQFAFVEVRPKPDAASVESWPAPSEVALVADDERFPATTTPGPLHDPYTFYEQGHVYEPDREQGGWLAFEVPNPLDAEEIVVGYDGHERSPGDEFRADLRAEPADFELVSFDAPERVAHDERFDVTCTVENAGPGDGTFRACLNQSGPMYAPHRAEFPIAAGERRERVWTFGQHVSAGTEETTFRFRSPVGDRDVTVEVVSETTTA